MMLSPDDCILHSYQCENLKSNMKIFEVFKAVCNVLGCDIMQSCKWIPRFNRKMLSLSSGLKCSVRGTVSMKYAGCKEDGHSRPWEGRGGQET
jgi:hypothetical protein